MAKSSFIREINIYHTSSQGTNFPQATSPHKPPSLEDIPSSIHKDEHELGSSIYGSPCPQRLDSASEGETTTVQRPSGGVIADPPLSPGFSSGLHIQGTNDEGDRPLRTLSGNTTTPAPASIFGNSLDVQGTASSVNSVPNVSLPTLNQSVVSVNTRDCERFNAGAGHPVVVNNSINSNSCRDTYDSRNNIYESKSSTSGSCVSASGSLSPAVSSASNALAFPSEPTILAEKYIVLGPVDASTSHAVHIQNYQPLHIKAVSPRTAREVCCQQALLGDNDGVRAPVEAVVSETENRAWLVFPPHYGDLHSYVRLRRRLREPEAQRLFSQVTATVEKCHASGLVLRDLKLRKFVFTDSNRQHVVLESVEDSVVAGESDLLHDKHGCPAYVAPEILSAAAYSGRHADMWGLGVILYTMLVGRYPFHNADTSTLFARIRSGKFLIPEWVSSRARHLILSLLRRQPHRRLSARQVLLHPWLNRHPRDHVGKDPQDHMVPSFELTQYPAGTSTVKAPPL